MQTFKQMSHKQTEAIANHSSHLNRFENADTHVLIKTALEQAEEEVESSAWLIGSRAGARA